MIARGFSLACAVLWMASSAFAQSNDDKVIYVGDRFEIGVHEDQSLSSTIIELVSSGTALKFLARDGNLVQVSTPGGNSGWVDGRFLSEREPSGPRAQALEEELAGAQAALADAQARIVALESRAEAPPEGPTPIPSDALREMQLLAEENQRLKQQLAELEAVQRMARERDGTAASASAALAAVPTRGARSEPVPAPALDQLASWPVWQMVLFASVLLLAFGAGGWLVDWGVRRRHGGFRV